LLGGGAERRLYYWIRTATARDLGVSVAAHPGLHPVPAHVFLLREVDAQRASGIHS